MKSREGTNIRINAWQGARFIFFLMIASIAALGSAAIWATSRAVRNQ